MLGQSCWEQTCAIGRRFLEHTLGVFPAGILLLDLTFFWRDFSCPWCWFLPQVPVCGAGQPELLGRGHRGGGSGLAHPGAVPQRRGADPGAHPAAPAAPPHTAHLHQLHQAQELPRYRCRRTGSAHRAPPEGSSLSPASDPRIPAHPVPGVMPQAEFRTKSFELKGHSCSGGCTSLLVCISPCFALGSCPTLLILFPDDPNCSLFSGSLPEQN